MSLRWMVTTSLCLVTLASATAREASIETERFLGTDADMSRPERLATEDNSKLPVMNRTAGLFWGYGKY